MYKLRVLLILGILVSILPYLGFPYIVKNIFISFSGFGLIYISYLLYEEKKKEEIKEKPTFENFSENHDFVEVENNSINNQEDKKETL
jgi:hypothetical protein